MKNPVEETAEQTETSNARRRLVGRLAVVAIAAGLLLLGLSYVAAAIRPTDWTAQQQAARRMAAERSQEAQHMHGESEQNPLAVHAEHTHDDEASVAAWQEFQKLDVTLKDAQQAGTRRSRILFWLGLTLTCGGLATRQWLGAKEDT